MKRIVIILNEETLINSIGISKMYPNIRNDTVDIYPSRDKYWIYRRLEMKG